MARRRDPRDVLEVNREQARAFVEQAGTRRTHVVLKRAQRDLETRLAQIQPKMAGSFTAEQLRVTLHHVRAVTESVKAGLRTTTVDGAREGATLAAQGTIDYLKTADRAYRGIAQTPLALDEGAVFEQAVSGAQTSVLMRLASSGEPVANAEAEPHPAKQGILDRYGLSTIRDFEQILQTGVIAKKSFADMRSEITEVSPWLQSKPGFWAERIVRTELMGSYNRANWEATREADEQLEDVVKILAATFDDRTAADSFAVHGQIRYPDEAFESWFGLYQHPPNRPNDREIVVTHRLSWPRPGYLEWKSDEQVEARWRAEGRKQPVPERPEMSTVPLGDFASEG
jgi:hypothetical protein